MLTERFNVLVIGGGSIARRHISNLKKIPGIKVVACTRNPQVQTAFGITAYSDLAEALECRPVGVIVANRTSDHMVVALAAAERACHLLVEKPVSHSLHGIETLAQIRNHHKLVVLVGCNMRFHPALKTIKRALDTKRVGHVLSAEAHCGSYLPDWRPERDFRLGYSSYTTEGGGVILDLIHELDYLYWFFGDVEAVTCFLGRRSGLEIEAEDIADMLLRFKSGLVAQVHLDYVERAATRGCRIVGQDGTLVWNEEEGRVTLLTPSAGHEVLWSRPDSYDRNSMYVEEMEHFIHCIQTGGEPFVSLQDGRTVLEVVLAAKQAAQDNRVVIL